MLFRSNNFFIKNGSYGTIHTFKNYFAIVFSVFSFNKISSIFKWILNLENLIYYINYFVETEVMAKCQNEANDKRKKKTTSVCSARVARVKERKKRS